MKFRTCQENYRKGTAKNYTCKVKVYILDIICASNAFLSDVIRLSISDLRSTRPIRLFVFILNVACNLSGELKSARNCKFQVNQLYHTQMNKYFRSSVSPVSRIHLYNSGK